MWSESPENPTRFSSEAREAHTHGDSFMVGEEANMCGDSPKLVTLPSADVNTVKSGRCVVGDASRSGGLWVYCFPDIDELKLLDSSLECWTVVVACCIALSYYTVEVPCQYHVRCVMTKVVRNSVVEEPLSFRSVVRSAMSVTVAEGCVVDSERNQSTVEALFNVGELYMLF